MQEKWKVIEGFGNRYEISEFGIVRSINYNDTGKTKLLSQKINKYGYVIYGLSYKGKVYFVPAHKLVWLTFKGKIPIGYQINHIDENKQNNHISNLNLMTIKENCNWGTRNERSGISRRKPVIKCDLNGLEIKHYQSIKEAAKSNNIKPCYISAVLHNYQKTAGGFIWKYK